MGINPRASQPIPTGSAALLGGAPRAVARIAFLRILQYGRPAGDQGVRGPQRGGLGSIGGAMAGGILFG